MLGAHLHTLSTHEMMYRKVELSSDPHYSEEKTRWIYA